MLDQNVQLAKPSMRGVLHQAAFYYFVGAGFMLVAGAQNSLARAAAIIYVLSLMCLFGFSALYHLPNWDHKTRRRLRKLDHSSIYVMIAGSASPMFLLALPPLSGKIIFGTLWVAAALGVFKSIFWPVAPRWINVFIYILMPFLMTPYLGQLGSRLGGEGLALITLAAFVYFCGALVYALRKPNPNPQIFGYHEIFHALVVVASLIYFKLAYHLILNSPASSHALSRWFESV